VNKMLMHGSRWAVAALVPLLLLIAGCQSTGGETKPAARPAPATQPDAGQETEQQRRARIRLELGASYYQQGNFPVAIQELQQALAIDPDFAPALGMLGLVHMDLGERDKSEGYFRRALRVAPDDSDINNNYGWFLCQTGRPKESIDYFMKALANPLYQTPSRPLHNAGICSRMLGDEKAAEQYFLRAFQVDPRNPVAMFNLADLYLKRGDLERARFYSQRLIANYEPSAETLWLALRIERQAGNADGEASLAAQLRRRFPASAEAARLARGDYGD
jgi:type IV pilus assembly protein PilF